MSSTVLMTVSAGDQFRIFSWVVLGFGLGAFVGLEREFRGHVAGIRTTSLVCGGAAMFAQAGSLFGDSRIAAGVVQGVGFLGVGLIFHTRRGDTKGVTTAATMWAVAAIGLLVGFELWLAAILVASVVVVLLELAPVSDWVLMHGRARRELTSPEERPVDKTLPRG